MIGLGQLLLGRFAPISLKNSADYPLGCFANPDLAERLRGNHALNTPNKDTFYGEGSEGYTDYPRLLKDV